MDGWMDGWAFPRTCNKHFQAGRRIEVISRKDRQVDTVKGRHTDTHRHIRTHARTHKSQTTPHYITLHYTTLHYTTLHYTKLHYTTLHYTTLHLEPDRRTYAPQACWHRVLGDLSLFLLLLLRSQSPLMHWLKTLVTHRWGLALG